MRITSLFFLVALAVPLLQAGEDSKTIKVDDAPIVRAAKTTDNGMELFSWHLKGDDTWHFALLPAPGIENLKTVSIVTARENEINGVAALKRRLSALALNEKVGWFNMLDKKETPPEDLHFDFPPKEMMKELELHCTMLKVRLNIYQAKPKK